MMDVVNLRCSRKLLALLPLCLLPALCLAQRPADFHAKLELSRNDKLMGEMTFTLASTDERWTMSSDTKGSKGLAKFLGLKENSTGEGDWDGSAPRPLRYERNVRTIMGMQWTADFDWENGVVHTVYPDGESRLELEPGVLDESAIGLVVRAGLAQGEDEWHLRLVDEDEIEDAHFRTRSVESVQTALGCMKVHIVEKVRGEGSTRYTRTYYAEDHQFVPVLMEHGRVGGNHVEGRVVELTVNGQRVPAGPDCQE
jgi:hypothetical protein